MKISAVLRSPYALILPAIALCLIFSVAPTAMSVRDSFRSVDYVSGADKFIGLANYRSIFTDDVFLRAFKNSVLFMFGVTAFSVPFGVAAALFLDKNGFIRNFTQSVIFTPHIVSFIAVATLWMFMMDPRYGILNYILGLLGLPPLRWLMDSSTSLLSLAIVAVWKTTGFNALIVIAALQKIPAELYESARLDRSTPARTFFHITLPTLSPILVFLVTASMISAFGTFDIVKFMTEGGPRNSSNLMVYWIYRTGFLHFQIGRAMAGAVILILFLAVVSAVNLALAGRRAHYQ
ncbi:MAG: sugar ABC transporter permease [Synergistaceae bacterium]|jgi:sn-glycerol 3-phosphate transport system permease protein|nr:sugar ABC transporter permease [Synergistaceae bacterium]